MTRAVFSSLVLLQSCGPHKLVGCDPGRVLSSRVRSCFRFSSVRISLQQELNYTPPVGIEGQGQRGSGNPLRTENIYVTMPGAHDNSLLALFPRRFPPIGFIAGFQKSPLRRSVGVRSTAQCRQCQFQLFCIGGNRWANISSRSLSRGFIRTNLLRNAPCFTTGFCEYSASMVSK